MRRGDALLRRAACAVGVGAVALLCGPSALAAAATSDLAAPEKKVVAMQLVSSAENSTLQWRRQFGYLEDIDDGRGYTGGLVGFTSGTGDMLALVRAYTDAEPRNPLRRYLPALERVNGTDSHRGLGRRFVRAWHRAAHDRPFRVAQEAVLNRVYFDPAVALAKADGLGALGQFCYYDAAVVHGPEGLEAIHSRATAGAQTPAAGGDETAYLNRFLDERVVEMRKEAAHEDVSRIETAQRRFLRAGNLDLHLPLRWSVYGDRYAITS